jgi:hypothetical protein
MIFQEYYEIVKTQLMSEKGNINFLTADGNQEHNKKYLFDYFIGVLLPENLRAHLQLSV